MKGPATWGGGGGVGFTSELFLNLFAASDIINYVKSWRLYIQQMRELSEKHPGSHQNNFDSHHAIRHSCKYRGGLWTDLCIEQVLM